MNSSFRNKSKGAGTLIASAFMILMLLTGFSVFFLMRTEAEDFQSTLESMDTLDWERSQEKAIIEDVWWDTAECCPPDQEPDKLYVTVRNTGSIDILLIKIGVFSKSSRQPSNHTMPYTPLEPNILIKPGETIEGIGPYVGEYVYDAVVQLVTARGNIISETYPKPPGIQGLWSTAGIGFITIEFEPGSFMYTSNTVPEPDDAWMMCSGDTSKVIWHVRMKSHADKAITLLKWSWLELADYAGGSPTITDYYIVDPGSNNTDGLIAYGPEAANAPQILEPPSCSLTSPYECTEEELVTGGEPITVKFASNKISPEIGFQTGNINKGHYNLFIMLYYEYNGVKYGQIIPFAGIIVTE
ncbi:MAG: hypothetical protein GTN80_09080 [Nitrososphaeria archaeon]|nr:hypothetical protein [Nitrososphaeria archaeon]NIN53319.1 hypothetical protein [Nitrososphaeria archaeon]NIQ33772.1 hypothetical protein [Nitrososphaeria archaeon]